MFSSSQLTGGLSWPKRYAFAQKQAVIGLAFSEIEKTEGKIPDLPTALLYQWIGDVERIKRQNLIVNREVEALAVLLDANDIKYAVVKGQTVASYYERPELRTSGDVDFYVPTENVEKAKALICNEWHVEMEKGDSPYHYHFEHGGVIYEMHFKLFRLFQKQRDQYWQKTLNDAMGYRVAIGSTQVATLEPTVHALYVFMHLYHHLVEVGVGLRQFCDLAMLLKADIDREQLKKNLGALGMTRAFRASEYILKECIGLSDEYLPYEIRAIDRWFGRRMLDVVLYRGNMGHYNKRNGWSGMGHQVESACIKLSHFVKFFWLSPGYHLGWMKNRVKFR